MAKGKRSSAPPQAVKAVEVSREDTRESTKVNLADGAALKRALDEAASKAVLSAGYQEDQSISNLKIGFSLITCAFAALAQFYPRKYPDNWVLLAVCVLGYMAGTGVLNFYVAGREGDAFMFTKRRKGLGHELRISSSMQRYSEWYTMVISSSHDPSRDSVSMRTSVTKYFDSTGVLATKVLEADVTKLLNDWESQRKRL
ncbi:hypothetical protein WJX74_005966 [Apatococcus lobatus]|uniref:Signal peptidase complex subunit 2 n=1 Tax=Apatococcus lobatus TaxID=904363 RepID=A0AAW1RBT7_9CHLO